MEVRRRAAFNAKCYCRSNNAAIAAGASRSTCHGRQRPHLSLLARVRGTPGAGWGRPGEPALVALAGGEEPGERSPARDEGAAPAGTAPSIP